MRALIVVAALALAACGQPQAPDTAAGPPTAIPHPAAPAPDAGPPRFVGRWATAEGSCEQAWEFRADGLETPGHVACTFSSVTPASGGYDIAATCTAEAPPAPYNIEIRFAESARAMLVSGGPMSSAALIACPAS